MHFTLCKLCLHNNKRFETCTEVAADKKKINRSFNTP